MTDSGPDRVPLSAIILTRDESINIVACLRALSRVADVIIVDSGSIDGTIDLARSARSDIRVFHHEFVDFGDQRNWALDHTAPVYPWILFVDADEYCDPELLDEINRLVSAPNGAVGGFIAGRNYFLGRWLKRSTMYPSYQLRLLRQGYVRFVKDGHGQREIAEGPLVYLRYGWRHEAFSKGVQQWVTRHNHYSTEEAVTRFENGPSCIRWSGIFGGARERRLVLKSMSHRLPGLPVWRFLYAYVVRGGFLDGRAGFLFCLLLAAHNAHIQVKVAERRYLSSRS